jgi:4'-phosphopantetheinyl transferase
VLLRFGLESWVLKLGENQVDVWRIHLCQEESEVQRYRSVLSPDEIKRADRFHFEKHRQRFTTARAAMRQILGGYTDLPAGQLAFSYGAKGKPELSGAKESSGIRFNLSHSANVGLLAVTRGLTVGVDVELINFEFASDEIAERFFSANEVRRLRALAPAQKTDGFFACWTRKEAYIKALGEGLSVPLDNFEVAFGPGVPPALLQVKGAPGEVTRWSMYDIEAAQGYRAALVVEGKGHDLRHLRWEPRILS